MFKSVAKARSGVPFTPAKVTTPGVPDTGLMAAASNEFILLLRPRRDTSDVRVQALTGAHTHIFSPTIVNDLRVTYLRRKFIQRRPGLGTNLAGAIGLTGVSDQAFPVFTIPGYGTSVATAGSASGQTALTSLGSTTVSRFQTPITDRQVLESLSWSRGTHAYEFGCRVPGRCER